MTAMWTLMPIFCFNYNFILIHFLLLQFLFFLQYNNFFLFYFCTVSTTAILTLMPILCLNFNFIFDFIFQYCILFFYFFYSIILFHFIFVLCQQLQCWHSCQYFQGLLCVHKYCTVTVTVYTVCTGSDLSGALCKWR